jgi:hypothetical protein
MCLSTEPQSPPKTDLVTSKPTFTPGQKVVVDDALGAYGLKRGQVLTVKQQDEDGDLSFEETGGGWYSYRRFSAQTHAPAPASAKSVIPDYILARLTPGSKVYAKVYRYGQGIHADREYELANVDAATGKVNLAGVEHRLNWTDIHPMFVVGDAIKLVKNLRGNTIGLTGTVQEVTIEGFNSSAKVELSNGQIQTGFLSYFELDAEKQTPPKPEIEIFPAVTAVQVSMDKLGRNPMNSGKTFTFKRGTDPVTGKPGWQVQEIPGFHPVPSLMVPHDLIEHEPGSASTPEEEFKAIGTALYLRGETGFFPTNGLGNFTDAMIAGAIEPLFFHVLNGNAPTSPYQSVRSASQPLPNVQSELTLIRFAAKAVEDLLAKYGNDPTKVATIESSMAYFIGWVRIGYRRAVKRFQGVDRKRLGASYAQLWKLADTYLGIAQDGDVLTVTWKPEQYEAAVQLHTTKSLKA